MKQQRETLTNRFFFKRKQNIIWQVCYGNSCHCHPPLTFQPTVNPWQLENLSVSVASIKNKRAVFLASYVTWVWSNSKNMLKTSVHSTDNSPLLFDSICQKVSICDKDNNNHLHKTENCSLIRSNVTTCSTCSLWIFRAFVLRSRAAAQHPTFHTSSMQWIPASTYCHISLQSAMVLPPSLRFLLI